MAKSYQIHFAGGNHSSTLYTARGAHPRNLVEAAEAAENEYTGEAFEIWGPDGSYQSSAFKRHMKGGKARKRKNR